MVKFKNKKLQSKDLCVVKNIGKGKSECLKYCKVLSLVFCYISFLLLGAVIISEIEAEKEEALRNKRRFELLQVYRKYNISIRDQRIKEFLRAAHRASEVNALKLNNLERRLETTWGFNGALFYIASLVTTVGYGNKYPRTDHGRWFTVFYAIIGIPFTGIVIASLARIILKLLKRLEIHLKRKYNNNNEKRSTDEKGAKHVDKKGAKTQRRFTRSIIAGISLLTFLILLWLIPAVILQVTQPWDIASSLYFCFITISTIGIGDITPDMSVDPLNFEEEGSNAGVAARQLSTIMYILVSLLGITVVFTTITAIWKEPKKRRRRIKIKPGDSSPHSTSSSSSSSQ